MKITCPLATTVQIEAYEVAAGVEEDHDLAVGNRGGSSEAAAPILADSLCHIVPPEELSAGAVETHRQQRVPVRIDA